MVKFDSAHSAKRTVQQHARAISLMRLLPFAAALLAGLLWWLPARWLATLLPESLRCESLEGSVWQGYCSETYWRQSALQPEIRLGLMNWQLSKVSLLKLRPELMLQLTRATGSARGQLKVRSLANWQLTDGVGAIDYPLLAELWPSAMTRLALATSPRGSAQFAIRRLDLRDGRLIYLDGDLEFDFAGRHRLSVRPDGTGTLQSLAGTLALEGDLRWQDDGSYRLQLLLSASPAAPPTLLAALPLLGSSDSQGRFDLTLEGSLRAPRR